MGSAISADAQRRLDIALASLQGAAQEIASLLSLLKGQPDASNSTLVAGTEDTNVVNVVGTLLDAEGVAVAKRTKLTAYLSDDANGDSLASTGNGFAIGTDGLLLGELTADHSYVFVTESDGTFDIDITETGTATYYLIVAMPNGELLASDVLTFTA